MIDLTKIEINNPEGIPDEIVAELIQMMEDEEHRKVIACDVRIVNQELGEYGITPTFAPVHFNRIRRVTGYHSGDVSRFNDAKRAEERDRVKHEI